MDPEFARVMARRRSLTDGIEPDHVRLTVPLKEPDSLLQPDTSGNGIGINSLKNEKDSNGSDHLNSRKKVGFKYRNGKCMDADLHISVVNIHKNIDDQDNDHKNNDNTRSENGLINGLINKTEATRLSDFDSDEDTFADAESDCEPNQFFLDEMLEDDGHPERLSLLDYRKEKSSKIIVDSSSHLSVSDEQDDENDSVHDDSSTSSHDEIDNGRSGRNKVSRSLNGDADCESTTERSEEDEVSNLPAIKDKGKGRRMGLNSFGTSQAAGPGRPLLRQPSQKAVWGK